MLATGIARIVRGGWRHLAVAVAASWLCGAVARPAAAQITLDGVERLVAERRVDSVEALLDALPPQLKRQPVLIYDSRSLQEASLVRPRVVAYQSEPPLVVAVAGARELRGGDDVELIGFAGERFEFARVRFAGAAPQFERDPALCQECHGRALRPNWDSYPFWPGVYGSSRETYSTAERAALLDFLAGPARDGRYRQFDLTALQQGGFAAAQKANTRFGMFLAYLNFVRLRRELRDRVGAGTFAQLMDAVVYPDRTFAELYRRGYRAGRARPPGSAAELARWLTRDANACADRVRAAQTARFAGLLAEEVQILSNFDQFTTSSPTAALLALADTLGLDHGDWSMVFPADESVEGAFRCVDVSFSDGYFGIQDLRDPSRLRDYLYDF
jgi:hypothetical protein